MNAPVLTALDRGIAAAVASVAPALAVEIVRAPASTLDELAHEINVRLAARKGDA